MHAPPDPVAALGAALWVQGECGESSIPIGAEMATWSEARLLEHFSATPHRAEMQGPAGEMWRRDAALRKTHWLCHACNVAIPNESIVYVPSAQLGIFAERLLSLPTSMRVSVVAGGDPRSSAVEGIAELKAGSTVYKYGRQGKPHPAVRLTENGGARPVWRISKW